VVEEANAIGTTYLHAQTLSEPERSASPTLLRQFTDTSIRISNTVPVSSAQRDAVAQSGQIERQLWAQAGRALPAEPTGSERRGLMSVALAAVLVTLILVVTFDLDRPTRGLIEVPATPLTDLRTTMTLPPAAPAGR
jgi:hypothetical protein